MSNELKAAIQKWCEKLEIPLLGVASVDRWKEPPFQPWMPEEFYPQSIYPEARSVIVIGLPISLPVLETSPSVYYRELYSTVNSLLDQYTYRLSNFLNERGHPSVFVPRDGYSGIKALLRNPVAFFSHRHAALLAGLGNFGTNNMLLTPQYGPRVRFGSVFTAAELPPDPLLKEELCTRCMRCVKMCPAKALDEKDYPEVGVEIGISPASEVNSTIRDTFHKMSDKYESWEYSRTIKKWEIICRKKSLQGFLSDEDHVGSIKEYLKEVLIELETILSEYPVLKE